MPLPASVALAVAVLALAGVVLATVSGALPRVVATIGTAFGGIAEPIFASPTPNLTPAPIPGVPTLVAPDSAYTNVATATISGTVPIEVVGRSDHRIRIYVAVPDQEAVPVKEVPVGVTPSFVVPDLPLENGRNDITATIFGPGGESDPSAIVTYVLDTSKPKVTISSPKNGAIVNGATATIKGKTQGRATVLARNEANGTATTAEAKTDGTFSMKVPIVAGTNGISVTATDLAGNVGTPAVVSVKRGSGKLTVALSASAYRVSAARLPRTIELRAVVTDPNGRGLRGETVTFTLALSGVPALTGDSVTGTGGRATFRTTIPAGATVGSGLATAFVDSAEFGEASGRISIAIVK
jgi:hypothetical protein